MRGLIKTAHDGAKPHTDRQTDKIIPKQIGPPPISFEPFPPLIKIYILTPRTKKIIGATFQIGQEIQCLSDAGFFFCVICCMLSVTCQMLLTPTATDADHYAEKDGSQSPTNIFFSAEQF